MPRSTPRSPSPSRVEDVTSKTTSPRAVGGDAASRASSPVRPPSRGAAALALLTTLAGAKAAHVTPYASDLQQRGALPLLNMPARFDGEITLPVPAGFDWPRFDVVCLHEHSGSFRDSWSSRLLRGRPIRACSVAERRTMTEPEVGSLHVIGGVLEFLSTYPHPIPLVTGHVNCGDANYASWSTWAAKVLSGAMLARAEEIHYLRCVGALAAMEQPPTAHELILGPASFRTAAEMHGEPHTKTYLWFARGLDEVTPTCVVPEEQRVDFKASVSGTPEEKMLQRSFIARSVADAHTAAWLPQLEAVPVDYSRPALEPCEGYEEGRAAMRHNFIVFKARYAPRLLTAELSDSSRAWRAVIVVPIFAGDGTWVLFSKDGLYGARHSDASTLEVQSQSLAAHVSGDVPAALACVAPNAMRDYIVLAPHSHAPLHGAADATALAAMLDAGHEHVWCRPAALSGLAYEFAGLALRRIEASRRATAVEEGVQIGMWPIPRPVVSRTTAHAWNSAPTLASPAAVAAWDAFLAEDASAAAAFRLALVEAGADNAILAAMADEVHCASDVVEELQPPPQGIPNVDLEWLRRHPYPARTPSVSASWLSEIPPQRLPPGCPATVSWKCALRPWARRMICSALDTSADFGVDLWNHGSSSKPRGRFLCLGKGAAHDVPHLDGMGTWNYLDVLWTRRGDGLLEVMDISGRVHDHKHIEYLLDLFSPPGGPRCTDQELLSMLSRDSNAIGGVTLKVGGSAGPPRQIRIDKNLVSLDTRIRQVANPVLKLIKKGLYRGVTIRSADGRLDPESDVCPLLHVPGYVNSCGGADKGPVVPGATPLEARRIGNDSSPHVEVRERNSPHGEPDGPIVVSKNDLTGPKKAPPAYYEPNYDGPEIPWPDKERKQGPADARGGSAVLGSLAAIDGKNLVSHTSDVKWMFWQFYTHASQYHICCFLIVMMIEEELLAVMVEERVINMGSRPASKIACRFSEEWMEAWRRGLRAWVRREWLPLQSPALQAALSWRVEHLGPHEGDPFWAAPYTDDYAHIYLDHMVGVAGVQLELEMAEEAKLWMAPKYSLSTVLNWIGGRLVLNGFFSTLPADKRTRAITDCIGALDGVLTRERYESHASFMGHANLWLDFPLGTLKGICGPLKRPGLDTDLVTLTTNAAAANTQSLHELQHRPCASFLSAIEDATIEEYAQSRRRVEFASDSCSDLPAPRQPHICWAVHGTMGRFRLDGAWRAAHITLTEACGPALAIIELAPSFPVDTIVLASDASAANAAQLGNAHALVLQLMMRRLKVEPSYRNCVARLFIVHCAGFANILTDAGSRDLWDVVYGVAAAYGLRMRFPGLSAAGASFMADVISLVAEPDPSRPLSEVTSGSFVIVNGDEQSFTSRPSDIWIDRTHPVLGNFLPMHNESQRVPVCLGFDAVWHGRATVEEAAARAGVTATGRTASASVEERHRAASTIARRVLGGEHVRGVCHCHPRRCHGHTILRHVADIVKSVREAAPIAARHVRGGLRTLLLCMLFAVATPTTTTTPHREATAPASSGVQHGVHPVLLPLLLGMLPLSGISKSPSPLLARQGAQAAKEGRRLAAAAAAALAATAVVVVAAPRAAKAGKASLMAVSPQLVGLHPTPSPPAMAAPSPLRRPRFESVPNEIHTSLGSAAGHHKRTTPAGVEIPEEVNESVATTSRQARGRWSPQPTTAAAARAAAAGDLATTLARDTSKYALLQGRPEALADLCEEARALRDEGIKKGTEKRDSWGFNRVKLVCESAELCSPMMRPRVGEVSAASAQRESFWAALLVMKLIMVIAACPRNAAKGVMQGKPASALQAVYGYYAVQRDCGRYVPDFKMAAAHLRGLNERFKKLYGLGALIKRQAQPFSNAMLLTMIGYLTGGGGIPGWTAALTASLHVLVCYSVMTGTRKDEWSKDGPKDTDFTRRSNFQWMDGDREIPHTPENIRALPANAFLRGQAAPSKCDRYLQTWGARLQWFQRNDANPLNFASAWRRWELSYPCPLDERTEWAAFSPTGSAAPFSPSAADKHLSTLMIIAIGATEAALRSWHAFRVTLASALRGIPRKAGETTEDNNGVIQMCLRWSSVESVRTYSRINRHEYARYTELGSTTCALSAENAEPLPPTEPADVADAIDGAISEWGNSGIATTQAAATLTRAAADASPLTRENAKGREVLIPAEVWPDVTCGENGGAGWSARVLRCSSAGATLHFLTAKSARGRAFADVRLKLSVLTPL